MDEAEDLDVWTVTTTVGSVADAARLARAMVEQRLAACAQVEPSLRSFYHWQGRLCEEEEVRVTFKTGPAQLDRLQNALHAAHPYDLPQFTAVRARASAAYAQWVREELSRG